MTCTCTRTMSITAKSDDRNSITHGGVDRTGYVPNLPGLGGGDYLRIDFCLDCGKLFGDFPISDQDVEDALCDHEEY